MFDSITNALSGAWWAYPLILGVCLGDAILPLLPSETVLVTGGVLASRHALIVWLVLVMGAVGAWLGDVTSYSLGRWAGPWVRRRLFSGDRGRRALDRAEETLQRRGASIVVVARFIPGGRTATTFVAGTVGYPFRRFAAAAALGATIWASYATLLGFVGGATFEDNTGLALLVAFGFALLGAVLIEGGRTLWSRRKRA